MAGQEAGDPDARRAGRPAEHLADRPAECPADRLVAARLGARSRAAAPRAGRTRVLAVDGRSGAGKSTLAALLKAELDAPVVALEHLYGGWDGLESGVDRLVRDVLVPLAAGRPARVPHYDWTTARWLSPRELPPPGLLVVEGVGAGARRAAAYASLLVWLEAPDHVRRRRALARDGATYAPHWDRWAALEEAMLRREHTRERADLILEFGEPPPG